MDFNFMYTDGKSVSEEEDVAKCLQNIFSIPEGSIPLSRGLGMSWKHLSSVPPELENDYATDAMEKVDTWEPRVQVSEVSFSYGGDGSVTANVVLEKGDEEDVAE